ncbi:MAG: hypothetical protein R3E77_02325 [Steroidobacteraceae bacterium]
MTLGYGLIKFLHILLFVYWLGGDAGVYYSSRFVINPKLSRDARLTAAKIFADLDMLPRYCLALMLTVGGLLSEYVGVRHEPWMLVAIVLLGPVWIVMVHLVHVKQGTAAGQTLARIDMYFRWLVVLAILASVGYSWSSGRLAPYPWLAAKLLIFAGLIVCGLMIRINLPQFMAGFRQLAASGATADSDRDMIDGMAKCQPYVWLIWAGVAAAALIGILKPGGAG